MLWRLPQDGLVFPQASLAPASPGLSLWSLEAARWSRLQHTMLGWAAPLHPGPIKYPWCDLVTGVRRSERAASHLQRGFPAAQAQSPSGSPAPAEGTSLTVALDSLPGAQSR